MEMRIKWETKLALVPLLQNEIFTLLFLLGHWSNQGNRKHFATSEETKKSMITLLD